ncbi:ATP-dependent Clp protease proteolytic subunit [Paracoccaceae bacterium]|nr:ATP-dependent Clp protease proteolytic subunit [Paracoccaceae bacterium]
MKTIFQSRTIVLTGEITHQLAQRVTEHMLALVETSDDPINMIISSPEGYVEFDDMVHDMIKFIRPQVRVIGSGWVASVGALIFVGADIKDRYCLPNTRFLVHHPSGGIGGSASDMEIQANQIRHMRSRFETLFARTTGQTEARIKADTKRDFWLSTDAALVYGLVGRVVASVTELS